MGDEQPAEDETAQPRPLRLRPRGVRTDPELPEAKGGGEAVPDRPALKPRPRKVQPHGDDGPQDEREPDDLAEDPPTSDDPIEELPPPPSNPPASGEDDRDARSAAQAKRVAIKARPADANDHPELPAATKVDIRPRPAKPKPIAEVEIIDDPAELAAPSEPGDPAAEGTEDQLRLQDRKTGVSRLLDSSAFQEQAERLTQEETPAWEREGAPEVAAGRDVTRLLAPSESGEGYAWQEFGESDLLTPAQLRNRRLLRRLGIATAALIVLGFLALFGRHLWLSMQKPEPVEADVSAPAPGRADGLSEEEVRNADAALRRFARCFDLGEMLTLVRLPERVAPLMPAHYGGAGPRPMELGDRLLQKKEVTERGTFIVVAYEAPTPSGSVIMTAEKTETGPYLVDWELSTGYQPIPYERLLEEQPTEPLPFRVQVTAGDYHDHIFPQDSFDCYLLTHPGREFKLWGYTRKGTPVAEALSSETAGRQPSLILNLRYLDDPLRDDRVEITDLVKSDWFY